MDTCACLFTGEFSLVIKRQLMSPELKVVAFPEAPLSGCLSTKPPSSLALNLGEEGLRAKLRASALDLLFLPTRVPCCPVCGPFIGC